MSRLTKHQYRKALEALDITQQEAGELLGTSKRSGQRWAELGVEGPAAILIRLLLKGEITLADVRSVRE